MYEPPGANVVFLHSLFYGIGAGAGFAIVMGLIAIGSVVSVPVTGALGGAIGGSVGLVLGSYLVMFRPRPTRVVRAFVSVLAIVCAYLGLAAWLGELPTELATLLLVIPPGVLAWLLVPVVLRPTDRRPTT